MRKVLFSGFFDLLHLGHILAINEAKSFGDYLVIHIASDKEAKEVKGVNRPIIPGKERVEVIKNLKAVDEVIYHEEYLSYIELLDIVNPNILVLNYGSNPEHIKKECQNRNIHICEIKRKIPLSRLDTTGIINKIKTNIDGVNFIIKYKDKVLLQLRDNIPNIRCPNMWAFPGGGIENGEMPLMAVIREIKEETEIDMPEENCTQLMDFRYEWGETNIFYLCELDYFPNVKSKEGIFDWKDIGWFKNQKLAGNQHYVIETIQSYFN